MRSRTPTQSILKVVFYFCLCFLFVLLTACATPKDFQSLMKKVTVSDNSYAAGYIDGCDSGLSTGTDTADRMYFQDMIRYSADSGYAAGWDSGYTNCFR